MAFRFEISSITTPKSHVKLNDQQHTPTKSTMKGINNRFGNRFKVYDSTSSCSNDSAELEDEFLELIEMENYDEEAQLPNDLRSLLCKDVRNNSKPAENKAITNSLEIDKSSENDLSTLKLAPTLPRFNRFSSMIATPERHCLATINENVTPQGSTSSFKRPEPPTISPKHSKRHKGDQDALSPSIILPLPLQVKRPPLRKTVSMNDATIMEALSRSSEETDLIGDFSKKFCLPYIDGRHKDLRSISSQTLRNLLLGEFDDYVRSYKIIDCRYPYEFEGGHIKGALNLYTQEQIIEELLNKNKLDGNNNENVGNDKRSILIFHCEFSSERGPKLSRFLRNHDRMSSSYPELQYPEIYLLHGGYKDFFQENNDLCEPNSYRPMLDSAYSDEYKHFRAKSKSWTVDGRSSNRFSKSRSRLVL